MAMFKRNVVLNLSCLALLLSVTSASWGSGERFQAPQSYGTGGTTWAKGVALADVNRDGNLDLIVPSGTVGVLLGNGDGTFKAAQTYEVGGWGAAAVAIGDVNGDGNPDVIAAIPCTDVYCSRGGMVAVLLGNGDGTFQLAQTYYSGGSYAIAIAVADVNGDGKLDVLVAHDHYYGLGVLLGNGDGTFQPAQAYLVDGLTPLSLVVDDVNGDGIADVLMTYQYYQMGNKYYGGVGILLGKGDGTFQPGRTYYSGGKLADSMAVADVNGDGNLDLVVANECKADGCGHGGIVAVLLGNGDGTFRPPQSYNPGGYQTASIVLGDVDGDGKLDVLVANTDVTRSGSKKGVGLLLGNGDGTFRAAETYNSGGDGANAVAVGDVNRDGKLDVFVANWNYDSYDQGGLVSVLLGRFSTTTYLDSDRNPSVYGQPVTFAASVSSGSPKAPPGTVIVQNGSKSIGKATLSGGVAILTTKALAAGNWSVTATYNGNPELIKSTSAPLSQVVSQASTTTTIKSSRNPSAQGQPVTFTAKVTSPTVRATGTVTFTAGTTTLGIVPLSGGRAILTTSALPQGANRITATYDGNDNIMGSTASLTQIVN
jgi:hypothetical protein